MNTLKPSLKEPFVEFVDGFEPHFAALGTFITVSEEAGGSLENLFGREAAWIAASFMNAGDLDEDLHSDAIEDFRAAFAPYTVGAAEAPRSAILRAMIKMSAGKYKSNTSHIFSGLLKFDKLVEDGNLRDKIHQ